MAMIELLDQKTINKIAAGEVVERPSSVVKELVENSIDAGASAVTVEVKEGGVAFIRITDNGSGIPKDQIQTAFLRHSTSKIKQVEDLIGISSLGFRGEALASIAAVSQVEVISKTYENVTGLRYVIEGGSEKSSEEIGCPEGTTIIVKNLFYNTPARRKFLKKAVTEAGYISDYINKLALGNPHISFKFIYNNKVKLHTSGNNELKHCIFNVYGKEAANNIIPIHEENELFSLHGYLGKPQISRGNRNYETYYINGRYIKSNLINKAVEDGYGTVLTIHKYPFAVLHLNIDGSMIDVNVHPTKMEVKFHQEEAIYHKLKEIVYNRIHEINLIPEVTLDKTNTIEKKTYSKSIPEPFEVKRVEKLKNNTYSNDKGNDLPIGQKMDSIGKENAIAYSDQKIQQPVEKGYGRVEISANEQQVTEKLQPIQQGEQVKLKGILDKRVIKEHRIIGQLFNTYWMVELNEKMYIIDQHAAHEKVLYERLIGALESSNTISQALLSPIIVHVNMNERNHIEKYEEVFAELGFEIEAFGTDAYAIRSVPYIFGKLMKPEHFIELLDSIDMGQSGQHRIIVEQIASMACKAAVKAHDKLSVIEYRQLIDELMKLDNPYTCPHGRPTIISMTKYEIEKKFKRIQ